MTVKEFLNKTISVSDCQNLRKMIYMLTSEPVITNEEFNQFLKVIQKILERLREENEVD